ncbi:MAG TPA: DUF2357 domain-containing protein [Candidatus Cloacimonadota bacterium]|jgi:hypothetical protein|nr:DUF2357 domain-containing protein [Candidatus Cloacimonadota bacterium]
MIVLKLQTSAFILCVHADRFVEAYAAAEKRNEGLRNATTYSVDGVDTTKDGKDKAEFELYDPESGQLGKTKLGSKVHPVFFENTEYIFDLTFTNTLDRAPILRTSHSKLYQMEKRFNRSNDYLPILINYGNEIGNTLLCVDYCINGQNRRVLLGYEVFPRKMNYKEDYLAIIKDINDEYTGLVLSYLKKTFHGLSTGSELNNPIIWWETFQDLFDELIKYTTMIIDHPYRKLSKDHQYLKLDRIKRADPLLEEEIARYRHIPNKYYSIENKVRSLDNPENRFLKYMVFFIYENYLKIRYMILANYSSQLTSDTMREIDERGQKLKILKRHHFFTLIGKPTHLKQESLVLHKASGYSQVFRAWIILEKGIDFLNGLKKIELKNIDELYQLWCFVKLKRMIGSLLPVDTVEERFEPPINKRTFFFESGLQKKVVFKRYNSDEVEILHEFRYKQDMSENRTYTLEQKPDIVLKITKNDLKDKYTFTYLFDAKYRIGEAEDQEFGIDKPPEDAINQMHRYRDAIYYENKVTNRPEKEVIGGYILFPGSVGAEEFRNSNYFKSIGKINIGAFPFKPNNDEIDFILSEHLKGLLEASTEDILNGIIPHKELQYEQPNPQALIGIVSSEKQIEYFTGAKAVLYHTGKVKPSKFGYSELKYFVPYISKKGMREYYEILEYKLEKRNEIFPPGNKLHEQNDQSERLVLTLGNRHLINGDAYYKLDVPMRVYNYTTLYNLRNPEGDKIKVI